MSLLDSLNRLKSDESLMQAFQAGQFAAFEQLYLRHKDRLYRFFYYNCSDTSCAEDLTQDTWQSIIQRIEHYQPSASFKTYLFTVARRKLIDFYRRFNHLENHCDSFDESQLDSPLSNHSEQERQHHRGQLLATIKRLPSDQQQAFILQQEGFSLDEIAAITEVEKQTAKSRLRYAKNRLKQMLKASELTS